MSPGRTFLISASTLMSGTVLAQALTFALSFVLTRLYSPAEFGHYAIFVGCAAVLAAASTGALDRVIVLGRTDREARRAASAVLALSSAAAALVSVCGLILVVASPAKVVPLTGLDLALFVPLFMLCYAGAQIFTFSSLRHHRTRGLAAFKVGQSVVMGGVQVLAAGFKGAPGLALGSIAGWFVLMVAGLRWRLSVGHLRADFRPRAIKAVICRHWRYPRYVMPNEALDNLSNQAPVFLIGAFLSLSTAGHYGLAIMILSAPAAVMGQAVGQAFLQYMSRHGDDPHALRSTMYRIWLGMALVGCVPFGLIAAFGPSLFGMAFGHNWIEAGGIAQLLAPLLFVRLVSSPTSSVYLKLNLQREQWWFCVAAALYRTTAYGIGVLGFGVGTMILVHVVTEIVAILIYNLVALRRLRASSVRLAVAR